jgi:pimeloyl-ACP methyl ester carboxylesterase
LCLHAAARAPRLVRRLALYQPGGAYDATFLPPAPPPAAPASADTPLARIKAGDIESGLRLFLDGVAGDGAWAKADDLLRTILTANARTLIAMSRDASEPMTRAMAQAIEAPTLLIGGEGIPVGFTRVLDALESFIPNVRRARIASSSHFANIEAPEVFNRALETFFDDT